MVELLLAGHAKPDVEADAEDEVRELVVVEDVVPVTDIVLLGVLAVLIEELELLDIFGLLDKLLELAMNVFDEVAMFEDVLELEAGLILIELWLDVLLPRLGDAVVLLLGVELLLPEMEPLLLDTELL
ncbi:hypothetical protein LTR28_001096, partial [Elasticomyces elasticus]